MAIGIGRREFIDAPGSVAVAWPLASSAQQPTLPVVGFIKAAIDDREVTLWSSGPADFHFRALLEPYVNLSISYGCCSAISMT